MQMRMFTQLLRRVEKIGFSVAVIALGVLTVCALTPTASASMISGSLSLTNCTGGGVTVNSTNIDWTQTVNGGDGCIATGTGTSVTYDAGTLTEGDSSGVILDLSMPTSFPVVDFITFTSASGLHFDLSTILPSTANTDCSALGIGDSCSVFAGSPFLLTKSANGTSVTLSVSGTAGDLSGDMATWGGNFTTQFFNMTPAQIQTTILGGESLSNTYSGTFAVSAVPEAGSGYLLFGGLFLLVAGKLRGWRGRFAERSV